MENKELYGTGVFDFNELCQLFKDNGFEVETFVEYGICTATVKKDNVIGAFGELGAWYKTLDGRFAADHKDCFNKWSQAPLVIKLPCDFKTVLKNLDRLGSQEGYEHSNNYEMWDNPIFPYEMDEE